MPRDHIAKAYAENRPLDYVAHVIVNANHSRMQTYQAMPYIEIRQPPDLQDAHTLRINWCALTGLAKF
jgi:hypothetical protein